jgi:large subunit ribosomal protein L44
LDKLGVDQSALDTNDNQELTKNGKLIVSDYLPVFLRSSYPYLPEEGIKKIQAYLTSDETLSYIALHIGLKDLILTEVSLQTFSTGFTFDIDRKTV